MPFQIFTTITGPLGDSVRRTITVPHTAVEIVYQQHIPIPRLWRDTRDNTWKPERYGASLFDRKWLDAGGLDVLRGWCRTFAALRTPGTRVILDIEDLHPSIRTMERDSRANLAQLRADARATFGSLAQVDIDEMIAWSLRQLFSTLIDELTRLGMSVSCYGHTPEWAAQSNAVLRGSECWWWSRQRVTHPVLYEWLADRPVAEHAERVVRERVAAARRMCPLVPCVPFVTPTLGNDLEKMIAPEKFASMVATARDAGAAGCILWWHARDTRDLTRWLTAAPWINDALTPAAAAAGQGGAT